MVSDNPLNLLVLFVIKLLTIYMWVIIVAAVVSWVNPDPYNPIVRFLRAVTEPVFSRIRRLVAFRVGIDVSPAIAILGIMLLQYMLALMLTR